MPYFVLSGLESVSIIIGAAACRPASSDSRYLF